MDYRKIKSGMRVRLKNGAHNKSGTIKYVYQQDGSKYFDIHFDGEDLLSTAWSILDRKVLKFEVEEYKDDFDKLLKSRKK